MQIFSKSYPMKKQTHPVLDGLRMSTFSANFSFGQIIPLKVTIAHFLLLILITLLFMLLIH